MTESSGRQRGVDVVSATPFGSCARRGNNCQVFPDKLLRECEAALAIGGTSSGIEKEGAARKIPSESHADILPQSIWHRLCSKTRCPQQIRRAVT